MISNSPSTPPTCTFPPSLQDSILQPTKVEEKKQCAPSVGGEPGKCEGEEDGGSPEMQHKKSKKHKHHHKKHHNRGEREEGETGSKKKHQSYRSSRHGDRSGSSRPSAAEAVGEYDEI